MTASAGLSTSPIATPQDTPPPLQPSAAAVADYPYPAGTVIQVVADSVHLRETVGTSATIISAMARDMTAVVVSGPTDADGYTWFEIDGPLGSGWVAAGDSDDRWIVAAPDFDRSELAFRFQYRCDATPPLVPPALTVTAERDVVIASGPDEGGWQVGRLTPAAFAELMALAAHPALAETAEYVPEPRPEAGDPPGHGLCVFRFTLGAPDDRVHVTSVSWFGDEEESQYYLPAPERRALDELARRLMLGRGLFTDESWEIPLAEYQAERYLLWIWPEAASPTADAPSIDDLGVIGDPAQFGEPIGTGRCGYLDRADAQSMSSAFTDSPTPMPPNAVAYLTAASESGWVNIVTSPITPEGFPTCGDVP